MAQLHRSGSAPSQAGLEQRIVALDTGAQWTLIGAELIELLGDELGEGLDSMRMSTRLGSFEGTLHRLPIQLIAEQGASLFVEGTCLALPGWNGPNVIGVHGFLERIRFAVEPESAQSEARIHFGGA